MRGLLASADEASSQGENMRSMYPWQVLGACTGPGVWSGWVQASWREERASLLTGPFTEGERVVAQRVAGGGVHVGQHLYLSWLAVTYADANKPEKAARVATRMMAHARGLDSDRTTERERVVRSKLWRFRDVGEARDVLEPF